MKDERTFEEKLERLKKIVAALERGDLPLEEGVTLFKEGQQLSRNCADQLAVARNEVKSVVGGMLEDFEVNDENKDIADDS
ncbi:exodeoxyribonuclease VII small subunit [Maridesulfovibrio hydrothermalis]|uniref:Exodeoxyribonuclease 7 small subunit n=1 Tax=Maridesulfovibrio hydrothermalis AM13 = DSM 14728 TaxID=1121451 RepID=L0R6W3_9BACT|nr:exodeoxyribonuclease VII small subunit [Maridesulfovibrio hydrothermalis]CCO22453.1 Exodeoxyribonuclease 7 small subunit [Maridesulfovibrio hydrothermalis AM13 = DSM 14728]